jgi:hypothetical protein
MPVSATGRRAGPKKDTAKPSSKKRSFLTLAELRIAG